MPLTKAQTAKYWRTWSAVCAENGWTGTAREEHRHAVHAQARCPESMRSFGNRDFDRFLIESAALCNQIDIRDRERERENWTIKRLSEAIEKICGPKYVREILLDMHDADHTHDITLDPIDDQVNRGAEVARKRGPNKRPGTAKSDLQNIKRTLRNRFSKLLTKLKNKDLPCPAECEWWLTLSNDAVIAEVIKSPAKPVQKSQPRQKAWKPDPKVEAALVDCPF